MSAKRSSFCVKLIAISSLVISLPVYAQNDGLRGRPYAQKKADGLEGSSVLFHAQGGANFVTPSSELEGERDGYYAEIGGVYSYVTESMIFDLGLGYMRSEVKGDDLASREVEQDDGTTREQIPALVGLQTGYGSLSMRYRTGVVHFGPTVTVLFGEDTSFAPQNEEKASNVFVGAQIGFIKRTKDSDFRLSLRYDQDLSINERAIELVSLALDYGIPLSRKEKSKVIVKEKIKYRDRIKYRERVKIKKVAVKVPVFKYVLTGDLVNFETDLDRMKPNSVAFVDHLGRFIAKNSKIWKKITIEGHADSRGSASYNQDLALRRARKVAAHLIAQGVSKNQVTVKSFGERQPIDKGSSALALARNRRVEIHFFGVTDAEKLSRGLDTIRARYHKPSTCKDSQNCK